MLKYPKQTVNSQLIVYGLVDPRFGSLRYIGKSTRGLVRPRQHTTPRFLQREAHTHKARWLAELIRNGFLPEIVVLRECTSFEELEVAEREMIAAKRLEGCPLTNHADGGPGPIGVKRSPEFKRKARDRMLGSKLSPETIAKRTASRAGWKPSAESAAKIAAQLRGRPKPRTQVNKSAAARRGVRRTPEQIEHIREGLRKAREQGYVPDTEHMRALGLSWRGKKRSEETKIRMSEGRKRAWAEKKARESVSSEVTPSEPSKPDVE